MLQTLENRPLGGRIDVVDVARGPAGCRVALAVEPLAGACRREGRLAGEQLVEHESQRVEIALGRHGLSGELLRSHVGRRPGKHLGALDLACQRGQAEVGDARAAATVEHHVGGLEIAVQDAELVRRGEPGAELARDLRRLLGRQPADATEQRGQVLAVDVLHREEVLSLRVAHVEHPADVGM